MKNSGPAARSRKLSAVCALILATQLVACGGSDDDGNAGTTPPPSSGGGGSKTPPPPPPPEKVSLKLQGRVTDEPIANAEVTATIGGETFTATADANGDYSLDIEIDEEHENQFVTLVARGVGPQAFVEFTSLAGSFAALAAQAGSDGTLSPDENFATQITNVSTAEAAFILQANGGEPVTSDAQLQQLAQDLNAQDVLDLAAAIKLAVDEAETYPLAEGQTILSLVSDADARQTFVNDTYQQNPQAFADAQASIVADAGLSQAIPAEFAEGFTTALLSTDPGFSFNYTSRVLHFDLHDDGTGYAQSSTYDVQTTWTLDGSKIKVQYVQPVTTVSFDILECPGAAGSSQVEAHYTTTGHTVVFLNPRTVAITTTSDVTYPYCAALEPHEKVSTSARAVLTLDRVQAVDEAELAGSTQSIYVYDAQNQRPVADIADIAADGTGTTRLTNKSFTWTLEEDGKIVLATFDDGSEGQYAVLRRIDDVASDIYWEVRSPEGMVYVDAGPSVDAHPDYAVELTADAVPAYYYQFGKVESDYGFRLRFDANGLGSHEDYQITQAGAVAVENDRTDPYYAFRWTIEGDDVVIRRTTDIQTGLTNCVFGTTDCVMWDRRRIIPLAADDNGRIYWLEHRAFNVNGVTANTPTTSLVRFYDREEFAAPAGVSSKGTSGVSKPRELLRMPHAR